MKVKRLVRLASICLVLILLVLPFMVACAKPASAPSPAPTPVPGPVPAPKPAPSAGPIKLKVVTFLPGKPARAKIFESLFINKVNELAKGELVVEWIGGVEAIPMLEQGLAVQKGIVDMAWVPASYVRALVPGIERVDLSLITPEQERQRGLNDYLQSKADKAGLFYLGRGSVWNKNMYLFTNKYVKTPYDLSGQKFGPGTTLLAFQRTLGIVPVTMNRSDMYTALEHGVIDGYNLPLI